VLIFTYSDIETYMIIDTEKRYCLYLITNLVNGKIYIGKTGDLKERWCDHRKVAFGGKELIEKLGLIYE
jgi:hypothetical protein